MGLATTFDQAPVRLRMRVALHYGPVVDGLVGWIYPRYHLFGHSVDKVMALEQAASPHGVIMSSAFFRFLMQEQACVWPHTPATAVLSEASSHSPTLPHQTQRLPQEGSTPHACWQEQQNSWSVKEGETQDLSVAGLDVKVSPYVARQPKHDALLLTLDTLAAQVDDASVQVVFAPHPQHSEVQLDDDHYHTDHQSEHTTQHENARHTSCREQVHWDVFPLHIATVTELWPTQLSAPPD